MSSWNCCWSKADKKSVKKTKKARKLDRRRSHTRGGKRKKKKKKRTFSNQSSSSDSSSPGPTIRKTRGNIIMDVRNPLGKARKRNRKQRRKKKKKKRRPGPKSISDSTSSSSPPSSLANYPKVSPMQPSPGLTRMSQQELESILHPQRSNRSKLDTIIRILAGFSPLKSANKKAKSQSSPPMETRPRPPPPKESWSRSPRPKKTRPKKTRPRPWPSKETRPRPWPSKETRPRPWPSKETRPRPRPLKEARPRPPSRVKMKSPPPEVQPHLDNAMAVQSDGNGRSRLSSVSTTWTPSSSAISHPTSSSEEPTVASVVESAPRLSNVYIYNVYPSTKSKMNTPQDVTEMIPAEIAPKLSGKKFIFDVAKGKVEEAVQTSIHDSQECQTWPSGKKYIFDVAKGKVGEAVQTPIRDSQSGQRSQRSQRSQKSQKSKHSSKKEEMPPVAQSEKSISSKAPPNRDSDSSGSSSSSTTITTSITISTLFPVSEPPPCPSCETSGHKYIRRTYYTRTTSQCDPRFI